METIVGPANWTVHVFAESAARNGNDNIEFALDDLARRGESDDYMSVPQNGHIRALLCISEDISNADQYRLKLTHQERWKKHFTERLFLKDQSGLTEIDHFARVDWPVTANHQLEVEGDNTNNAQLETVGVIIDYGGRGRLLFEDPPGIDFMLVEAIDTSTTLTADVWTDVELTWPNTLNPDARYQIIGLAAASATGHWARLRWRGGEFAYRPGVPCRDVSDTGWLFWGDFGSFKGNNPPDGEWLASATDSDMTFNVALRELSGS